MSRQNAKDINDCNILFGGKVVVLGGDFRQVKPIVPKGTKEEIIDASFLKSNLAKIPKNKINSKTCVLKKT